MQRPYYQAPRPGAAIRPQTLSTPRAYVSPYAIIQSAAPIQKPTSTATAVRAGLTSRAAARTRRMGNEDPECAGFEPQNYLRDRCKRCFRLREKHAGLSSTRHNNDESSAGRSSNLRAPNVTVKRTKSIPSTTVTTKPTAAAPKQNNDNNNNNNTENVTADEPAEQCTEVVVQMYTPQKSNEIKKAKSEKNGSQPVVFEARDTKRPSPLEKEPPNERKKSAESAPRVEPTSPSGSDVSKASSTTTVLLPKQRQISLGHSKSVCEKKASISNASNNNGWQFMGESRFSASRERLDTNANKRGSDEEEELELFSLSSYKTARSAGVASGGDTTEMFSARSIESLNSASYAESFKTGKSPPLDDDFFDPYLTPTEGNGHHHFFADELDARALTPTAMEFNQLEFAHLRGENQRLQEQCRRYRHERKRWTEWLKRKCGGGKDKQKAMGEPERGKLLEEALAEMELLVAEYREENSALKSELLASGTRAKAPELDNSDAMNNNAAASSNGSALRERLQMSESQCEQLRRERKELQQEIEEMQDQCRVEEIEQFRELQRELEQSAKNGRILQFKLRKAERQRDQLQSENNLLAGKLRDRRTPTTGGEETEAEEEMLEQTSPRVAGLEQELRVAKEVSIKLHQELEAAEEKRYKLEDELFYQKEKVRELLAQNRWREARTSKEQQQTKSRSSGELATRLDASKSSEDLQKEVRDTMEREADLREQLRFTEADLQRTRQRLHDLEHENDDLLSRYTQLAERHNDVQQQQMTKSVPNELLLSRRSGAMLRSVSDGGHADSPRTPPAPRRLLRPTRREEENERARSASAEGVSQPIGEATKSDDELRRKNSELQARVDTLVRELAQKTRQLDVADDQKTAQRALEMDELRRRAEEERTKREALDTALAEQRALMDKLNSAAIDASVALNASRARASELEREAERAAKWEQRCKDMKQERIRVQADAMQLKKRTDEAVQQLEKMSRTHQQKEIGWMREKARLEEQLREQFAKLQKRDDEPSSLSSRSNGLARPLPIGTREEQQKRALETELADLRAQREQHRAERDQWMAERERLIADSIGAATKMNGSVPCGDEQHTTSPKPSRLDYKRIADNALQAAESLQRQYREYQRQYAAEVQRLNTQLSSLERELAERRGGTVPGNHNNHLNARVPKGYESPSLGSLTENCFTDNTTWDSRLLDAGEQQQLMTRSISPVKMATHARRNNANPMLHSRTIELNSSAMQSVSQQHRMAAASVALEDGDFGSEEDVQQKYRRTGSAGTNILFRIRREELSRGKQPSVRQMARAFESFEKIQAHHSEEPKRKKIKSGNRGLFGLLAKSSSMETSEKEKHHSIASPSSQPPFEMPPHAPSTLPRGGRNPFKGISSRIVERVRRSLSRSKKSQSRDATPSLTTAMEEEVKWKQQQVEQREQ